MNFKLHYYYYCCYNYYHIKIHREIETKYISCKFKSQQNMLWNSMRDTIWKYTYIQHLCYESEKVQKYIVLHCFRVQLSVKTHFYHAKCFRIKLTIYVQISYAVIIFHWRTFIFLHLPLINNLRSNNNSVYRNLVIRILVGKKRFLQFIWF